MRYRYALAGVLVAGAVAALTSIGVPGLTGASAGYSYGYPYQYQRAQLHVIKHVVKDNGGVEVASDWQITVTGGNPSPSSFPGAESPGTTVTIDGGTAYVVNETGPSGYTLTKSGNCTGPIPAGGSATCTLENNDQPAHLIVIKHVINDNSGQASASAFTMTINGVTAQGGNSFAGAESPGTDKIVTPGSYSVSETGPSGYVAFLSAGCTGTIALGQTKTCTITNNDIAPRKTLGYWKTHEAQTTALLPQKLGNYTVGSFAAAVAVFNVTNCANAIGCLAGQLLAAELNLANASDPCIQPTVDKANSFLKAGTVTAGGVTATGVNYTGPSGTYLLTSSQRTVAITLKNALDKYNNNKGCPNP